MAYTRLETISWGSSPNITGSIAYDYQRSGADMQYKVKVTINTLSYSDSYFGYPIYATIRLDGTTKILGHRIKAASPSVWSEALVYETGWMTVNGKSSGNTALSVNIYSGSGESRDKTYSYSLYVVPAASTMSFGAFTMGSAGTIAVSRASSKYTHTITYRIGNASGTIATKSSSTSISWNPSIELARQITNATQATGVLSIDTYNGSTKIAGKEYSFTLYVPSSVKPSATLSVSLVNSNSAINGWGVYVKGYSKLSYTVTASGAYGASIASCQFTFAGKTVTGLSGTVSISAAGNFAPSIKVTDSRGRSMTVKGGSITVYDYNPPSIAQLAVQRCEENGTARNDGTYVCVQGRFNVGGSIGGRNSVTAKCRYRAVNGSWSGYTTIQNSSAVIGGNMLATKTYQVEIVATDSVGEKKTVTVTVPTAEVAFHLRDGGMGAAFGKYAESDALECAWNASFGGNVAVAGALQVGGKPMDTGWIPLNLASGISHGSVDAGQYGRGAAYRIVGGNHVYVAFNLTVNWTGAALTLATLPAGIRPAHKVFAFVPVSGRYIMRVYIGTDGALCVEWMQSLYANSQTASLSVSWCDGMIDFFL